MKGSKTIVMATNDTGHMNTVKNALSDEYDVLTVSSSKGFFRLLDTMMPDLGLMDAELPEMDGHEVITKLKGSEKTYDIPVVLFTMQSAV